MVTLLTNVKHVIRGLVPTHINHAPDANRLIVKTAIANINDKAKSTREKPSQIIQDIHSAVPITARPYMPSVKATRKIILRARRKLLPPEPSSVEEINIPDNLKKCMMTVPNIFLQLYTIHAPVGTKINNKILPLVYALMTSKSEQCYEQLFEGLISICDDYGYVLLPKCIINDFEKAAINAVSNIFPECEQTGCFSHLGQSIWRKIQSSGLATHYGNDIEFALKLRCLWSLAFLPPEQIPDAFDNLSANYSVPDVIKTYFEENYIRGKIKMISISVSIIISPSFWSVYYNTENNIPRTQNNVESWHKRWKMLVGAERVGIYRLIIKMCKEQQNTLGQIELIVSGNQRPKPKLASIKRQLQIQNVIEEKNNTNTIDFLKINRLLRVGSGGGKRGACSGSLNWVAPSYQVTMT
ncbi:hypothetical protein QTP88_006039 [Uroleucon formosanum]